MNLVWTPNKQGVVDRANVTVKYLCSEKYYEELAKGLFSVVSCQGMAGLCGWKRTCFKDAFLS